MRRAWAVGVLLAGCAKQPLPPPRAGRPVWIDTDPAVDVPDRDVDDGVALLQALRSPELAVRGVSTVFGNAPLAQADPIGRSLVAAWAPEVPVWTGAAAPSREPTEAARALIAALERERLTILVLGPATNVATALELRPDLVARVEAVVAVAGRRPGQRFTTGSTNPRGHRDFNFELDPDAFAELIDRGVPLVLAGFDVSRHVWVDAARLDRWATSPDAARLVPHARQWLALWSETFGVDGFNPFDTLAVGAVAAPALLTCDLGVAAIEVRPDDVTEAAMQGTDTPTKPYLHVRSPADGIAGTTVTYCHDVDAEAFLAGLDRRLGVGR